MSYLQSSYPLIAKRAIAKQTYDFTIHCPEIAIQSRAGQFVHIRVPGHTLRRPISICGIDAAKGNIRIVFEVRGSGTDEMAKFNVGDQVDILGPLGNGFTLLGSDKKALVVGGGIGVPPMVEVAKHYGENATAGIGFRSASAVILEEDFTAMGCDVRLCTDDGTRGHKGFVTDMVRQRLSEGAADIIYACGPTPMLKAVAEVAKEYGVRCQVSLEERMGCGIGACLVCACKIAAEKGEAMKHVCKDGPVFEAETVIFDK